MPVRTRKKGELGELSSCYEYLCDQSCYDISEAYEEEGVVDKFRDIPHCYPQKSNYRPIRGNPELLKSGWFVLERGKDFSQCNIGYCESDEAHCSEQKKSVSSDGEWKDENKDEGTKDTEDSIGYQTRCQAYFRILHFGSTSSSADRSLRRM